MVYSPVTRTTNISRISEFDSSQIISLYKKAGIPVERFFQNTPAVELYQCNETLYRFYYPFDIFGDDRFYQQLYSDLPGYYYPERWEYQYSLSKIPAGSKVLEIGCGSGIFLGKLKNRNCEVEGLELNSKAAADCREKGLKVHTELIESFAPSKKDSYDVVCSFQVLEHVIQIKSFIEAALYTLKPGGLLIVSVPNSNPYLFRHDKYHTLNLPPHHSGLWNKQSLQNLATVFPLAVQEIKVKPLEEYKEWYLTQMQHYKTTRPWLYSLMRLIPRPVYKSVLRLFSSSIEGPFITAVYQKKNDQ
jgi:SAM-dependent methyltransferase